MERKPREECFFGIHFDFHAAEDSTAVGEHTTREQIQSMLEVVRPEFVQCDCKGHPGVASFDSAIGTHAPGFARDNLGIWREVTREAGIPLFLHYSGIFDMAAVREHPQWAVVDEKGNVSSNYASTRGGYVDGLMIPQLKEVIGRYGVDGVWVDGEAWAVYPDYSDAFLRAFSRDTGMEHAPENPGEEGYDVYMAYLRESFRAYLRHYTREIHRAYPGFQIASNWAFSTYMPEPVSAEVDYLSADYSPLDSYNTARFESRYLAVQGKPWDIMGWSFVISPVENVPSTKSACQMMREAAAPLSLGGGFQVYVQQNRDGSLESWMLPLVGEVSDFCRKRREYCFRAVNVPQVAVLLSTRNYYRTARRPLHPDKEHHAARGITQALLDSQLSVQLISEHHLGADLMRYPVLVLPETGWLEEETIALLTRYVEQGGHLIAAGPLAAQYFAEIAGVRLPHCYTGEERRLLAQCLCVEELEQAAERIQVSTKKYLAWDGFLTGLHGLSCPVEPMNGTYVLGELYEGNAKKGPSSPAATLRRVGKGSCTCVWVNTGEKYLLAQRFLLRDFWGGLIRQVFTPLVRLEGSHLVDVNISRKEGMLLIHLINTSGKHGDPHVYLYDEITPLYGLSLAVDCPRRPLAVEAAPEGEASWKWEMGELHIALEKLEIYTILAVREEEGR